MPIVHHPSFEEPNGASRLWRYMDLAKFCALLTSLQLWFPTADALSADDPHEGLLPLANYSHRSWRFPEDVPSEDLEKIKLGSYGPHDADLAYKIARERWNRDHNLRCMFIYRRSFYISCWHEMDHESAAMWKIYGSPGPGIAITTTVNRLKSSLAKIDDLLYLGRVRYLQTDDGPIDASNAFNAALTKRAAFAYEREVRIIYCSGAWNDIPPVSWNQSSGHFTESPLLDAYEARSQPVGRAFPIDLGDLLTGVWVSPYAPAWFDDVVSRLCNNFHIKSAFHRSTLLEQLPR